VSGFLPRDATFSQVLTTTAPATPALLVVGRADAMVPPERSLALAQAFAPGAARVLEHAGAHMMPTCSGPFKAELAAFLDEQVSKCK
jgi:pimeloyl-ACP methyl ester carboxylesterase